MATNNLEAANFKSIRTQVILANQWRKISFQSTSGLCSLICSFGEIFHLNFSPVCVHWFIPSLVRQVTKIPRMLGHLHACLHAWTLEKISFESMSSSLIYPFVGQTGDKDSLHAWTPARTSFLLNTSKSGQCTVYTVHLTNTLLSAKKIKIQSKQTNKQTSKTTTRKKITTNTSQNEEVASCSILARVYMEQIIVYP